MRNITANAETSTQDLAISQPHNIGKRDYRYWTPKEIAQLRHMRCVDGCSFAEIAQALDRPEMSIRGKLGALRLKLPGDKYLEIKRAVARRNQHPTPAATGRVPDAEIGAGDAAQWDSSSHAESHPVALHTGDGRTIPGAVPSAGGSSAAADRVAPSDPRSVIGASL